MKNFVSAGSVSGLALLLILSLAGCGGVSANPSANYQRHANTARCHAYADVRCGAWNVCLLR